MPYVPSKKTDGKSNDREVLDVAVEPVASYIADQVTHNLSLIKEYQNTFKQIVETLKYLLKNNPSRLNRPNATQECRLALAIFDVGEKYNYDGAFLGELNYAITRLIQRVPQIKVARGEWKDEFRYWLYAATVEALTSVAYETRNLGIGVSGVFEDIKDEYKRRVNPSYETKQILKSGDCYDTPYYDRLVEVVVEVFSGYNIIGHIPIMMERSKETVNLDVLPYKLVLKKK